MNSLLKSLGYLLSELSVMLLAIAAWSGAAGNARLRLAVAVGATLAASGMAMRWIAYWRKKRRKRRVL